MVIFFIMLLLFISMVGFIGYVYFRLVTKFDPNVRYWENLLPVWNTYILAKQVMRRPGLYILGTCILSVASVLVLLKIIDFSLPTEQMKNRLEDYSWFFDTMKIVFSILTAYLWGEVAQGLGKKRWLHRIMAFLGLPLIITVPIMAFDSSRPVKLRQEEETFLQN